MARHINIKKWNYSTKLSNDKTKQLIDNDGQIRIDEDEKKQTERESYIKPML